MQKKRKLFFALYIYELITTEITNLSNVLTSCTPLVNKHTACAQSCAWKRRLNLMVTTFSCVNHASCFVVVVQSPSHVQLFATPWTTACHAFLSLTISQSLPKFMSIASVMPFSHFILWHPVFLLPSIFPSIRDFSNESAVHIRWWKYWSFSFSISPSNEY